MRTISFWFVALALILISISCSDLKKNLPVASTGSLKIHDSGWGQEDSPNFHGKYLKVDDYDFNDCKPCHGSNLAGGTSDISCTKCHSSFPHVNGWNIDTASVGFHGKYLQTKDWSATECKACHGSGFDGGTSGKTCFTCHASFPHEAKFTDGHENYMENNNYPLPECKTCHGTNLTGGERVNISCSQSGCHRDASSNPKSPEACNTCHGLFSAPTDSVITWAPPQSLAGDTAITVRGVGAHQKHLAIGTLGKNVQCRECHTVPSTVSDPGHIDLPKQVTVAFHDTLANLVTANGIINPAYQSSSLTCNNTFCHGNWKLRKSASGSQFAYADSIMIGSNYSPVWTGGSPQSACGTTCHSLPPVGHIASTISGCSGCHSGVVDNTGAIINRSKHINGKINVFGSEKVFPQ
ncbi:MAG: hypothetical protein C0417_09990 [Chlorobiaceae bacterium]|nr:hypothetical protein [Chlorobiaceae bacterium]